MKKSFTGELLSGHKGNALEVPFDPAKEWKIEAQLLWRGRRGFGVRARVKDRTFESSIVPRQKKFYLLIETEIVKAAGLDLGSRVRVTVEPME